MKRIKIFESGGKLHWIKNLYLRLRYGGGCCDVHSLDYYLAKKIVKPLKRFRDVGVCSYPQGLTARKWKNMVSKMVWSFEFFLKDEEVDSNLSMEERMKLYKKEQEGFELFGKYFRDLWK